MIDEKTDKTIVGGVLGLFPAILNGIKTGFNKFVEPSQAKADEINVVKDPAAEPMDIKKEIPIIATKKVINKPKEVDKNKKSLEKKSLTSITKKEKLPIEKEKLPTGLESLKEISNQVLNRDFLMNKLKDIGEVMIRSSNNEGKIVGGHYVPNTKNNWVEMSNIEKERKMADLQKLAMEQQKTKRDEDLFYKDENLKINKQRVEQDKIKNENDAMLFKDTKVALDRDKKIKLDNAQLAIQKINDIKSVMSRLKPYYENGWIGKGKRGITKALPTEAGADLILLKTLTDAEALDTLQKLSGSDSDRDVKIVTETLGSVEVPYKDAVLKMDRLIQSIYNNNPELKDGSSKTTNSTKDNNSQLTEEEMTRKAIEELAKEGYNTEGLEDDNILWG